MKFFRYRRPSWRTILGLTKAKKQAKRALGITALLKPFRWLTNQKRTVKRRIGYESPAGRILRNGLPKPLGCLPVVLGAATLTIFGVALFIVGAAFCF
jgi:hypothetical protein